MNTTGFLLMLASLFIGYEALKLLGTIGSSSASADTSGGTTPATDGGPWINTVTEWAKSNAIDPTFVLALISQESNGNTTAHNPGIPGRPEDSWGLFQLNLNAHSPAGAGATYAQNKACAIDPVCALNYWGPHIKQVYNNNGGNAAFHANPEPFLQRVVPNVQGSIQWTSAQAHNAYEQAKRWLGI